MKENKKALKTAVKKGLLSMDKKDKISIWNFLFAFRIGKRDHFKHRKTRKIGYDEKTLEAATKE